MNNLIGATLFEHLSQIEDPRREQTKLHKLIDILVIAVCASVCGAEGVNEIEEFGESKQEWLGRFLALPNGIPSHDTFRRVFMLLKPEKFQAVFLQWVEAVTKVTKGMLVNIDGKRLRGTKSKEQQQQALCLVSAWAEENRMVLGQVKCDEKSNEITAIPELLGLLELSGCIVTIDAMGCQREIVKQIVEQKADYCISLKGNQGNLHQDIKEYFEWAQKTKFQDIEFDYCETLEKGHGRIETRRCWATEDITWLAHKEAWSGLKSIVMVESQREVMGGKTTLERRYFISSLAANAHESLHAVRGHWAIENSLHWVLDIAFREDDCRIRAANSAANVAVLRHISLNLLKQEKSCKRGIKTKRLKSGWDEAYLSKVLNI